MPGHAAKELVREGEVGTYHCWSRGVQRAFLCGCDPDTARDFDYRRGWIENLLAYQARVFAIDVGNFSVLGNHAHTILRTRPDLTATWSAEELAPRWKMAWPEFLDGQWVREPTDEELDRLLAKPEKIEQVRRNLSSLSWFMARWKEPIARLCNAETDCRGHFWEARFGSRELLDEEAVLTCSIYVETNPTSYASADHPAHGAEIAKCDKCRGPMFGYSNGSTIRYRCGSNSETARCDMTAQSPASQTQTGNVTTTAGNAPVAPSERDPRPRPALARRRASDAPMMAVAWSEYLRVVEAMASRVVAGGQMRVAAGDRAEGGEVDAQLRGTLERWGMRNPTAWLARFDQLDRQCVRVLGAAHRVLARARGVAQQRFHGISLCREIFTASVSASGGFT
jgi:hypothetical protein